MGNNVHSKQRVNDDPELRKKIRDSFKKATGNKNALLPGDIWLEETDNGIKLSLSMKAIGKGPDKYLNMQDDAAAFEGWAAVIYVHYLAPASEINPIKRKIKLGLQEKLEDIQNIDESLGHYNRFLYRAMKFAEEYSEWVELDPNLQVAVDCFKNWYFKEKFINNVPSKKRKKVFQSLPDNLSSENKVELYFMVDENEKIKLLSTAKMQTEQLYRQLPVGLFKQKIEKNNSVFTGGKSAIDLWAVDDQSIALFELKKNNRMIGIITELFFYSEYVNDVFIKHNNIYVTKSEDKESGYCYLTTEENSMKKIKAIFLTDGLHSLISKEVIELLNVQKSDVIRYENINYNLCGSKLTVQR